MHRVIVSLVVLICLTAFAPAPLPRPKRAAENEEGITVATFRGTWRIDSMMRTSKDGKHTPHKFGTTHVHVEGNTWYFGTAAGKGSSHTITIDATQKPAHLDFNKGGQGVGRAAGQGIIRRKGDVVEIIYIFGGRLPRPVSFEEPPDGQYLLTLRRER